LKKPQPEGAPSFYEEYAHLYDVAFAWSIADEVVWLLERFGAGAETLLEPACGSGRTFPEFATRGVEVCGVELSPTMIRRAHERMAAAGLPPPQILAADMCNFHWRRVFDGALCPINSLGYLLTEDRALAHLEAVARHLRKNAKYMVQLDLLDREASFAAQNEESSWEMERNEFLVKTTWSWRSYDPETRLSIQVCRFEILAGPGAGSTVEGEHVIRQWNWREWSELISRSPFSLTACYNGESNEREALPRDDSLDGRHLVWHELTAG
jgi:SAM-dependent methyltransferase